MSRRVPHSVGRDAHGFARDAAGDDGTVESDLASPALDAVEAHALGGDIDLIAFGLSCLALARLLAVGGDDR